MAFTFKHGDTPLEGYTIQRGVGRGGFGEVYYAISDAGKEVALKYLRDNLAVELRGVAHCMNLKSPYLVTLFDVKTSDDDDTFVVMEYIHGPSLRDLLIAEPKGLGLQKAAYFTRETAKGIGYLHDRGIVHRDLKPGNIFYEDGYVKIGDYGLSKFISVSKHSGQTASVGTVHYMAPEVGSGNYHRGIDIYSLGVMLYEMLCGRVPFEGSSMGEVLMKHLMEQPDLDGFPSPVSDVIRKALAKDPQDRYQRVEEMIEDLFEVDDVANSVAGFVPNSLSAAVKRIEIPTPPPKPANEAKQQPKGAETVPPLRPESPQQPTAPEVSPEESPEAWEKYADLMEQWGKRFGDEMDRWGKSLGRQLAGKGNHQARRTARNAERLARHARRVARKAGKKAGPHAARVAAAAEPYVHAVKNQKQRMVVATIVSAALAMTVALLADDLDFAPLAFFGIVGLTAAVLVAERLGHQVVAIGGHNILRRLLTMACALPVLFVGLIMVDGMRGIDVDALGAGILISTFLIDWSKRLQEGVYGQSSLGYALGAACAGGIVTVMIEDDAALAVAALMASVSLISQTVAPVFVKPILEPLAGTGRAAGASNAPPPPIAKLRVDRTVDPQSSIPGDPMASARRDWQPGDWQPAPRSGGGFRRFFWMFVAAGLVSAGVICFTCIGLLNDLSRYDEAQLICIGTGLCVFGLFPLWQALRFGSRGFWMGFVRRFIAVTGITMAAVGGCMIGLSRELSLNDDVIVAAICMTIAGGIFGAFFLSLGMRPGSKTRPYPDPQPVGEVS